MTKNSKGGKGAKKQANHKPDATHVIPYKIEGQLYGKIIKIATGTTMQIECCDDVHRNGHIRKSSKLNGKLKIGDMVLVNLREYESAKLNNCDIIFKYQYDDAKNIISKEKLKFSLDKDDIFDISFKNNIDDQIDFNNSNKLYEKSNVKSKLLNFNDNYLDIDIPDIPDGDDLKTFNNNPNHNNNDNNNDDNSNDMSDDILNDSNIVDDTKKTSAHLQIGPLGKLGQIKKIKRYNRDDKNSRFVFE